MKEILQTTAFVALTVLFIARTPWVLRRGGQGRTTWIASGIGAIALVTTGALIPQTVLDAPLGGSNVIKLIQTVLAMIALWLLREATLKQAKLPSPRFQWTILVAFIVISSVSFAFITDRGETSANFLRDHITQYATLGYAVTYLVGVAWIVTPLISTFIDRPNKTYRLFFLGALTLVIGSIVEIAALTMGHMQAMSVSTLAIFHTAFDVFFYSGIILMAAGMSYFVARRWVREFAWRLRVQRLASIATRKDSEQSRASRFAIARRYLFIRDIVNVAYELLIAIQDQRVTKTLFLSATQERFVTRAQNKLATHISPITPE